jgi:6-phosphofructokinase 1
MNQEFEIKTLGRCTVKSPLKLSHEQGDGVFKYIHDGERVIYESSLEAIKETLSKGLEPISFEKAGPREHLFFEPAKTKVGIVTCGGLCPGLNNVIRGLVMHLFRRYGVNRVVGIMYGFEGLSPEYNHPVVELNPDVVDHIHFQGGSILGSSRGEQDIATMVDTMEIMNLNILFCIGGDGTLKATHRIAKMVQERNLKISVCGIPKTIDNDINYIHKSFGFETAFTIANQIIRDAHNEAKGAYNGVALVKVMGRDSGFIAASAVLSIQEVNFVIVPEMDFDFYGPHGFMRILEKRLKDRHHALIVVAEGAGQDLFDNEGDVAKDASGNIKYKDIGIFLKDKISEELKGRKIPFTIKYIDPSYIIRSAPANANDSKFCLQLSQNAVHAAMAGKTDFIVGNWNDQFTLLPISVAVKERKRIDIESDLWWHVLESTGQPYKMKN